MVRVEGVHHQKYIDSSQSLDKKDELLISSLNESTYFAILRD